ncbi:MAG: MlaD family protein [Pseudomonadota bacterium]
MSEKPQAAAIGAFIIGALAIAVTTLIYITGVGLAAERDRVVMVFDGSVKGLNLGAPVALRGVQIGQVTDIKIILDTETIDVIMLVEAELNTANIQRQGSNLEASYYDDLIARGLRAQLNTQSLLTGLLYIQLDFHNDREIQLADIQSDYTQIPTIPTDLERLTQEIEQVDIAAIADNLETIASGLSSFIGSSSFQQIPADIQSALRSVETLSASFTTQLATSGPQLDTLLDEAATTVKLANRELPAISAAAQESLSRLDEALVDLGAAADELDRLVSPDSPTTYQLNEALKELASASRAVKLLARTLEEQPEALIRGRSNTP